VLLRIALLVLSLASVGAQLSPGLAVKYNQGSETDWGVVPYPALHVPRQKAPSLLAEPGRFKAEFSGWISVDLRAQYRFSLDWTGNVELFINDKQVLNCSDISAAPGLRNSLPIRLNKGTNAILLRYTSPENRDAKLRLFWTPRNSAVPIPIPANALSHSNNAELDRYKAIHDGAYLAREFQCVRCHAPPRASSLTFDAPDFAGIGSRLNQGWMEQWILDPAHQRTARMPKLLNGADAKEKAQATAAFLATLTKETPQTELRPDLRGNGAALVKELHCAACHSLPGESSIEGSIALDHVARKFQSGALVNYLKNPQAHYSGNPMPNFQLTSNEAESIAAFLSEGSAEPNEASDVALVSRGKEIVQSTGCLNCHAFDVPNHYLAPAIPQPGAAARGCLDPEHPTAPQFHLADDERASLKAFVDSGFFTKELDSRSAEFAVQTVKFLRCDQCHKENSLPSPLALGGKLKPEWTSRFIHGNDVPKPRPWLKARMPAFPAYAADLAVGLAALHGHPSETEDEPPGVGLFGIGEKLIGSTGGFSCVACHAVGSNTVQMVVESPGINLAYSGERLLPDFFMRWLMNPLAIDPGTKMPAYFDAEGRSQLTEFLDGDARSQIEEMWYYIRSLNPRR
jgi:mono/diheme cytochrome c family protein